jgi:tetratricopeptide (TPR) repeat protein
MPDSTSALIELSERRYFAGALNEAITLLRSSIASATFGLLGIQEKTELRLQLGKLLVIAIFMEGLDPAAARQELGIAEGDGDARQRAAATDLIGLSHYYEQLARERPDFSTARRMFESALAAREAWSDGRELSESHLHLGLTDQFSGEAVAALDHFTRAYDLAKGGGHKVEQSFAVRHLGFLHRGRGALLPAYECMLESLRLREEIEMAIYLPFSHLSLAEAALALGRSTEARQHFELAKELAGRIGNKRASLLSQLALGRLHRSREEWAAARASFRSAQALAEEIGHRVALAEAVEGLKTIPD